MPIISLTSIPPRFDKIGLCIDSLTSQSAKIDEIRLYIPKRYRRFPDFCGGLPEVPSIVKVVHVDDDYGPASKFLHAAQDMAGEAEPILFCDDDRIYPADWAAGLLEMHDEHPLACIAAIGRALSDYISSAHTAIRPQAVVLPHPFYDGRKMTDSRLPGAPAGRYVDKGGYIDILHGYAGALVMPNFFDEAFFSIPNEIWMVDDIWLSGHLARRSIPIWLPERRTICLKGPTELTAALRNSTFNGVSRQDSNVKAIRYFQDSYQIWL